MFKTLWFRDHWADVDETWHIYSTGLGTKLLESGILNLGSCTVTDYPKLSPVGIDDPPPERGVYSN